MNKRQLFASIALCSIVTGCALIPTLQTKLVATESQAATPSPAPDLVAQALDRGDVAEAILQIETRWKKQFEDYFQGQFTTQLLPAADIARSLNQLKQRSGRRSALLYAIPGDKHLDLMIVTPSGKLLHRRINDANRAALMKTIQSFRMGVVREDSDADDYLKPGQQLYRWMIAPVESELQAENINQLIFCLGTGLRSVPMAALHDGKQFLIERYNLALIPAFNLLDRQARTSTQTRILAMGASTFSDQPPLPGVPIELSTVTQQPWQGTTLLNQSFTLENLKAQRAKFPYGIVHLATHAEFASGDVSQSYIQFWDQKLRLDQLKSLQLSNPPVQLLVLSACQTALGDRRAEMGFAGLAVQSGSKAAIASLWSVSDSSTLLLMQEFYRELKIAAVKGDALRDAQIEMIRRPDQIRSQLRDRRLATELKNKNLRHPFHWAAFTLIGNPW